MYTVGTVLIVGAIALTGGAAAAVLAASDGILEAAAAEAAEAATEQAAQLAMANAKFEILQVAVHALASAGASAGTMYWAGGYLLATGHRE